MTDIPRDWLRRSGTPEQFERARLERIAVAINVPFEKVANEFAERPFGHMTEAWRVFVRQLGDRDELWFLSSPDESYAEKLGCQRDAIVRDGIILDSFVTLRT